MTEIEEITVENCRILLASYIEKHDLTVSKISKVIGCNTSTINRIIAGTTFPTDDFIKQAGILIVIGYEKYKKLSDSEKENISEKIGAVGGGVLGFGAITAAISASGTVAGLSAAGIVSGLVAIGPGGMVGGVLTVAAIPIAAGVAGYGIIKGIKYLISEDELNSDNIDAKWEREISS